MNKVFGKITTYAPVRIQGKRTIVSYDFEEVGDGVNATWNELYYSQREKVYPAFETVKNDIIADINAWTDEKILTGFVWNDKSVWLSNEYQFNFKAAYDLAIQTQGQNLPLKFKLGEVEVEIGKDKYGIPIREKQPVYHTFETVEEFTDFYTKVI